MKKATRIAEILLNITINPRRISIDRDLSHGITLLDHFPVHEVKVTGAAAEQYAVDEVAGLIVATLEPSMYHVEYQVGSELEEQPAYVRELIKSLTKWQLHRELTSTEEIVDYTTMGRFQRAKAERERKIREESLKESGANTYFFLKQR